jgi:2-haloacid dehalogenase
VNILWWEKLERGEADRDTILVERHRQLFAELGIDADPAAFEADYRRWLGVGHYFVPGAEAMLAYLRGRGYRLFLASNGVADTQRSRLESAGIGPCFEAMFISELVGANKPDRAFFDHCFAHIPGFAREKTLMIGDSLTSDIRGGRGAGIDTLWFNRRGAVAPAALRPTYEITDLAQIPRLL